MIFVVNVCKESLHYFEFVKPIEDVLRDSDLDFFTKHYLEMGEKDLAKCDRVIICGTSLKDNEFMKNVEKFLWIKDFEKPVFGICAGMQIIGVLFGGKLREQTEIGFFHEGFEKEFFGLMEEREVYHLHNYYVDFGKLKNFEIFTDGKIPQAVKHKDKEIYGVLFHPEVRNKEMIAEFGNG